MTLILTVNGPETIWLLADRRLTSPSRPPKDDARKVMFLETDDGVAILGYAGLGATARGTEPADWMAAVLRGRKAPLEQCLSILADAMKRQLPRHLANMPLAGAAAHNCLITAFVGGRPRLYTIDLVVAKAQDPLTFRFTRHVANTPSNIQRTPRLGIGGSGLVYLINNKRWMRPLLHLVRASDRKQITPNSVADFLARLNHEVHLGTPDGTVGPNCIVAWRNRKEGVHRGGGAHQSYSGTTRDPGTPRLPTIGGGMDIGALIDVMMPRFTKMLKRMEAGEPPEDLNKDEVNADLAKLPDEPDEDLL